MSTSEKRKQSLYFPDDMLNEIMSEAVRLDRSLSWVVQRAWVIASQEVARLPSVDRHLPAVNVASGVPITDRSGSPAKPQAPSDRERQPGSQVLDFIRGKFENDVAG